MRDSEMAVFLADDGSVKVVVDANEYTVWLSQQQIADLYGITKNNISIHMRNIFNNGELSRGSVVKKILTTATDGKRYNVTHYNLDAIISVGYRVNSKRATAFRIWATDKLRKYLVDGYVANQARLEQLGKILNIIGQSSNELLSGTASVLNKYMSSLKLLNEYDNGSLRISPKHKPNWTLTLALWHFGG